MQTRIRHNEKLQEILSALISHNPEIGNHINNCETCRKDFDRWESGVVNLMQLFALQMNRGSDIASILRVDSISGTIQKSIAARINDNHN